MTLFYPQAVLFDLDGTLVDSAPDLTTAVNRSLADLGRPPITEAQARAWIGNGARRLVARALAGQREIDAEPAQTEAAMAAFFHHYRDCLVQASRVYDGVVEGLAQLAALECPMAVVTNKPGAFTLPLLEALGLDPIRHPYYMPPRSWGSPPDRAFMSATRRRTGMLPEPRACPWCVCLMAIQAMRRYLPIIPRR
jgi:phosphoglycolate phosphatase-like HAD superfamily hydrolase